MSEDTLQQLGAIQADIARSAGEQPAAVIIAMLATLIDVAAGDNPALRDYNKLRLYRKVRDLLSKSGI